MEKSVSYFDWEQKFRKKTIKSALPKDNENKLNSLGIPVDEFKSFLKKWSKKNLSPKEQTGFFLYKYWKFKTNKSGLR